MFYGVVAGLAELGERDGVLDLVGVGISESVVHPGLVEVGFVPDGPGWVEVARVGFVVAKDGVNRDGSVGREEFEEPVVGSLVMFQVTEKGRVPNVVRGYVTGHHDEVVVLK